MASLSSRLSEVERELTRAQSREGQLQRALAQAEEGEVTSLPNPCLGTATSPGAPERQLLTASVQSWELHRLRPQATPKRAAPLGRVGEGLLGNASPLQGSQVQRPERPDRGGPSLSRHTSLLLSPPQAFALAVSPHPPVGALFPRQSQNLSAHQVSAPVTSERPPAWLATPTAFLSPFPH